MSVSPDERFAGILRRGSAEGWQPDDPDDDLDDLLPGNRPLPRRTVLAVIIILAVLGTVGFVVYSSLQRSQEPSTAEAVVVETPDGPQEITVHVAGAVKRPGVVRVSSTARVTDAIDAAGGSKRDAQLDAVNLARQLEDGEQIYIPTADEATQQGTSASSAGSASGGGTQGDGAVGAPVNINAATAHELETLPGIGPATSAAIIQHRDENGPFASVDDLEQVPGIGPATLEKLRPLVTV